MGTNNFQSESGQYYCWETESDFDVEIAEADLGNMLEAEAVNTEYNFEQLYGYRDRHELRSYGSKYIGTLSYVKMFNSYNIEVYCHVVLRFGYYSGINADYHFDFGIGFNDPWEDTFPATSDIVDELEWSAHFNHGMAMIHGDKIAKRMTQVYEQLEEQVQNTLARACQMHIKKVGQFSNGEAVYQKA